MIKDENDVAIRVKNVSKDFVLPHEKNRSVKSAFLNFGKGTSEVQHALLDISFEVRKGEFFGIVGRNGGGKSTLLKTLAGIYQPTKGTVEREGSLVPFIELGVGFNPELSGRDNVFLNGALLGFGRKEMSEMYDDIVEFAELERFMDQKLKNYSSGMQVRLAFSIAIRAKTDILLIDEVLAVGDVNFQRKCFEYFKQIKNSDTTVLFVSHDSSSVQRYCDRALLIEDGRMIAVDTPDKIIAQYIDLNVELRESKEAHDQRKGKRKAPLKETNAVQIESVTVCDEKGKKRSTFKPGEDFVISVSAVAMEDIEDPVVRIAAKGPNDGLALFTASTFKAKTKIGTVKAHQKFMTRFTIPNRYHDTDLMVSCSVFDSKQREMYASAASIATISTFGWPDDLVGLSYPDVRVDIEKSTL